MENQSCVRVLHVIDGLGSGGAESFLMNMYRNIDREKVQFDFLLRSEDNIYKDELEKMGSKVYVTASFPKHFIKNYFETKKFLKEHKYEIIHIHANALLYLTALILAKKEGVKCRIVHSHSISTKYPVLKIIHNFNKNLLHFWATDYFACSEDAGKWMFKKQYLHIKNSTDLDKFKFNRQKRECVREELGIDEDVFVIGHIGRFLPVKNHSFILSVFKEILENNVKSKLILVGEGENFDEVKEKVNELGLTDNVLFLGVRKDIDRVINAFDVFLFPSLYEGLPMVLVESQANGITSFISDVIPKDVLVSSCVHPMSLQESPKVWAKTIIETNYERQNVIRELSEAGFDIKSEAKKLESYYVEALNR